MMSSAIGNARSVDLNAASPDELDRIGGLGHDRVQRIIDNRPFRSWDDVKRIEGFGDRLTAGDLRSAGATIGSER